ncbi:hypothetical protein BO78DRAFT_55431 [Aspergillus sclerotiicarbonarius CBS 121057]|uniref:Uncharacterized protein n=1 Tax=Aspergillus sclerotiicarbonarius (strain CBS 121057 / IBT 28362) TaxID=1448318 RepID=A0A319EFE0_ASPSB|nr:hypothetical protein BO78DRAFT_55431 [Aspergillus sclerotiicarbonarius CBS 121057]
MVGENSPMQGDSLLFLLFYFFFSFCISLLMMMMMMMNEVLVMGSYSGPGLSLGSVRFGWVSLNSV